ncbi:MAG: nucleoside-diphosphate kinase [Minisyncoccota bacterium]
MSHPKEERTLILVKPDALQRGLLGEIISRFERKGLQIVGMKMIQLEDAMLEAHYAHIKDKPFFSGIRNFMKSSPVVAMVLSGINAVSATRIIVGPTKAYEASAGSIRGDFSLSIQSNIVHASDSPEAAKEEVERFFKNDEVFEYERVAFSYIYADESFS